MKKKVAIMHFGCAKNLVDTELMAGKLISSGYEISLNPEEDNLYAILINTCSFIHDAEKESVRAILECAQKGAKIVVTGCLAQKYQQELKEIMPEITSLVGISDISKIADVLDNFEDEVQEKPCYVYPEDVERAHITVGSSAYIKIAEGCDYACGYCVIPKLRGKYTSRKIEDIVREAKSLAKKGIAEVILIAQDTTNYGIDIYGKPSLDKLLEELNKLDEISWIRVLYTYPTNFTDELIQAYKNLDKVVKYVDIPLQHSHPAMLKRMCRPVSNYEELIGKIRKEIPNVCIRTTFITGYPAETDEEFEHLKDFIQRMRFDRVGVFAFSREKGTYADKLKPQTKASVKNARKKELLAIQQKISYEINTSLIGKVLPCIIEQVTDKGAIARSYKDSPDVDGLVYIKNAENLAPCNIVPVEIIDASEYDLWGRAKLEF